MDLFRATPAEVLELMQCTNDAHALSALWELHDANRDGDDEAAVEAVGKLADLGFAQGWFDGEGRS